MAHSIDKRHRQTYSQDLNMLAGVRNRAPANPVPDTPSQSVRKAVLRASANVRQALADPQGQRQNDLNTVAELLRDHR